MAIHKASVDLPHDPVPGVAEDVRRRRAVFKAYRIGLLTFHLVLLAVIFSMGIGWVTVMNYGNPGVFEFMVPTAAGFLIAWAALSYIFAIGTGALMYMCKVRVQIYTLVSVGLGLFSGYVLAHYFIRLGMNVILMVFYG
ncbi:MAG: hypothetical protein GC159_01385 [Phycisphaera sp.]|nr:hypothetical protein [Phycisphaera sp.]